jgi:hypothetical protein
MSYRVIVGLLMLVYASAEDFSGKWSGSSPDNKSVSTVYAVLKQDGTTLTGSAGPSESRQYQITTGKADGDHLVFEVKMGGGIIRFDLTAAASELKGNMQLSEDGGQHSDNANVVLKRIP